MLGSQFGQAIGQFCEVSLKNSGDGLFCFWRQERESASLV